jgi:ubiquinone/menaquinone biosynthesis C-methylase UbiE
VLLAFLGDMEQHGLLGESVLDVGAGSAAVSDSLASKSRKVVQVDSAGEGAKDHVLLVQLDIQDAVDREGSLPGMRAYIEKDTFDTVICSHILNYVDFRTTLEALHRIHTPGGRLIIFNQPFEGEAELFSPQCASDNLALLEFLAGEGYVIEYLQAAPWVHVNDYDADLRAKSVLIVAKN